jgi:hypothetical protein
MDLKVNDCRLDGCSLIPGRDKDVQNISGIHLASYPKAPKIISGE